MGTSKPHQDRQPSGDSILLGDLTGDAVEMPDDTDGDTEEGARLYFERRRDRRRKMFEFVQASTSAEEIDLFAKNWNWDGDVEPLLALVDNPSCDAGTLLFLFWYGCPEDYYLQYSKAEEADGGFERAVCELLQKIEQRFVAADYSSASIPFDPTKRISMWDRRDKFARQIPEIMYRPITES